MKAISLTWPILRLGGYRHGGRLPVGEGVVQQGHMPGRGFERHSGLTIGHGGGDVELIEREGQASPIGFGDRLLGRPEPEEAAAPLGFRSGCQQRDLGDDRAEVTGLEPEFQGSASIPTRQSAKATRA